MKIEVFCPQTGESVTCDLPSLPSQLTEAEQAHLESDKNIHDHLPLLYKIHAEVIKDPKAAAMMERCGDHPEHSWEPIAHLPPQGNHHDPEPAFSF